MKKLFTSRFQLPLVFALLISAFFGGMNYENLLGVNYSDYYECDGRMMTEEELLSYRDISLETMQLVQAGRGLTYAELCEIPQAKLDRAIYRSNNPKPDHPGEAMEFRRMQLEDENGEIPLDAYTNAQARIDEMIAEQELGATSAGIENASWNWIGPGNIGGRVRALAIHPSTPDIMWTGSVAGGIWKTTNGGASWQAQDDFMANLAVTSIVIDPTDPNTLYAGTGEGFWNGDAIRGAGVFKTINGGVTWEQLASTTDPEWYYVNRLAISKDGGTLLAATGDGIFRSTNGGVSWDVQTVTTRVLDIDFDPNDATANPKAVASGTSGDLWYSTNGGVSWTSAVFTGRDEGDPSLGRIEVAYASSTSDIVYVSANTEPLLPTDGTSEIWRSTDGGQSYVKRISKHEYLGGQGWYDNVIWVDPTNADTIIVGGIDLWRSTDGGVTLTKISEWWNAPSSAHADHHMILEHPDFDGSTNKTVYFGNDGGVYKADDVYTVAGTSGWTELNNNLGVTQFYGAAGNPTTGDIIGGTQDNGTLFYGYGDGLYEKSTEGWIETFGGDGGFSAADPTNPDYFYGEYVGLQIHRSSDAGGSAEYIDGKYWYWNDVAGYWEQRWKNLPYRIDDAMNGTANFIAPFILDPNNPNSILAGGLSLWRTTSAKAATTDTTGPAWYEIKEAEGGYWSNLISAIAVEPGDSNTIWVGHNNGELYKTVNGGTSWSLIDTSLPDRYLSRIAIDSNNTDVAYVTFTGFNGDNIYKTTNGGSSWSNISGSLPVMPIRSVVINPLNSNYIYLGAEFGVFVSENAGATWDIAQDGPAKVSVDELFFLDNTTLVAATHGRGLYTAQVGGSASQPANDDFDSAMDLSTDISDAINGENGKSMPYTVEYPDTTTTLDTMGATTAGDDPAIADCDIAPGHASVWYKYNPGGSTEALTFDTIGSNYDTYLAIWTGDRGNLTPVACNDDIGGDPHVTQSEVSARFSGSSPYYIEVGEYNGDISGMSVGGNLVLNIDNAAAVDVEIGGVRQGEDWDYAVASGAAMRPQYDLNTGPVLVTSSNSVPIIATERLAWMVNGTYQSFSETMGLPVQPGDVLDHYIFPWYNNQTMNTELRVGNIGTADTYITVTIAGVAEAPFLLKKDETARKYYDVNTGPMEVTSDGVDIIATQRHAWYADGMYRSISEMLGLPFAELSDSYVFSWYNNQTMDTQLRISNVGDTSTVITVKIGGEVFPTFSLDPDEGARPSYDRNSGPVEVTSSDGVPIIVTERLAWMVNGTYQSFSETMGLPTDQVSDHYIFPWYNNQTMNTELRVGNIGTADTYITVTIAGVAEAPFLLKKDETARKYYDVNTGPMEVTSDGVDIIATQRHAWYADGMYRSISEMLGLPFAELSDSYVFSWYNNTTMNTQLRFGVP